MIKKITPLIVFYLLAACTFSPKLDLSDTKLYMFPSRIYVPIEQIDFEFTNKERQKAKLEAKKRKYDILYEVYLNKDSTTRAVKLVKKTKYTDNETVSKIRHQLREKGFFNSLGTNSAFFYGVTLITEVEYM